MTQYFKSLFFSTLFSLSTIAMDIYVDPSGNDNNSGSKTQPVASLRTAQKLMRPKLGKEAITIHVADGIYYLDETLIFTPKDSGTAQFPLVIKAQNEGKAILSGGSKLELKWTNYKDGILHAPTPAGLIIDQLFINGKKQRMARYPNYDSSKKSVPYQGYAANAFSKERASNWTDPKGGFIHAMHARRWGGYHYIITGKDAEANITYEGGWQNNRPTKMHPEYRMVENIFEELDAPGEWFHNSKTNILYFMPSKSVDLSNATVEIVRLKHLIEFQGSVEKPVRHIQFHGFTIRHTSRTFMDCKEALMRSDWAIYRGGAFLLTGTENIEIHDCEFDQVGGNAIFVNNYNRHTLIKGCHIHDAGASGICFVGDSKAVYDPLFNYKEKLALAEINRQPGPKTNNYPANSIVEDCLIHGIGRVEKQPAGIQIQLAQEIIIRDCSIYDCARAGINIGDGAWGGHLIDRCDVFDTVLETHDHGSFNSWGRDRFWSSGGAHKKLIEKAVALDKNLPFLDAVKTTIIRNSRWRCDHGWDIDLDDGSSNYDIYNNLMLGQGLKLREGYRRHVWNNTTPFGSLHPHIWFDKSSDKVYNNIFASPHLPAAMRNPPYTKDTLVDKNFFISNKDEVMEISQKLGWDKNSLFGPALFTDALQGDFSLATTSKAFALGYKNYSMSQFGVKKPTLKAKARTPIIPKNKNHISHPLKTKTAMFLGAKVKDLRGQEFSAYGSSQADGGVAIMIIPSHSIAAQAGLKELDLIQEINKTPIKSIKDLRPFLSSSSQDRLSFKILRDQQVHRKYLNAEIH